MQIAQRITQLQESITLKLNTQAQQLQAQGQEIFNLTAGQLPIFPPPEFCQALANNTDKLRSFQYAPVAGVGDLRKKVIQNFERTRGVSLAAVGEEFDCLISNGGKQIIFNALMCLLNPGDKVLLLAPYWISYPEMVRLLGGENVIVPSDFAHGLLPEIEDVQAALAQHHPKVLIVNSPSNPAGRMYPDAWMKDLATIVAAYPELTILSDEIYFDLNYGGAWPSYFYQKNLQLLKQSVICSGISKNLASTGLRIGHCIAPKSLIAAMAKLQGQSTSGANSLVQYSLLEYDFTKSEEFLQPILGRLKANLAYLQQSLKQANLAKCCYPADSAFYYMLNFAATPAFAAYAHTAQDDVAATICEQLLAKTGVVLVPGTSFGLPNSARLALVLDPPQFIAATDRLIKFLNT
ncbi:MAG: aminotransferase class I/II-fold pyridoxal phosphate-dependent enzyme [Bacteriovoracaceae bacterium]|nr:aminotransferase class I/II-fold pyridoxal phosphate-dependent enzyme [Bacteriovoracaceae bacterium]